MLFFHREQNKDMQVVMGTLSLDTTDPSAQVIEVENAIVHENYRETSAAVFNDIGKTRCCVSSMMSIIFKTAIMSHLSSVELKMNTSPKQT